MGLICTPYGYSGAAKVSGLDYQGTILGDKPVAYWPLNEISGTVAHDLSGNGFNMAYQNSPTLGAAAIAPGLGKSVLLNGSNQYVELAAPPTALQLVEGSFEAWFNLVSTPNGPSLFTAQQGTGGTGRINFALTFVNSPPNPYAGGFNGSSWADVNPTSDCANATPYHWVLTNDGTNYNFYINGVNVGSASALSFTPNAAPILIGQRFNSNPAAAYLNAYVSNCAIYPAALTAAQVLNHYNAGIA